MTTRITDKQRVARIKALADPWASYLGLTQTWDIRFGFADNIESNSESTAAAEITFSHPYRQAYIRFKRSHIDHCGTEDLTICIVHELVHVLLETINGPLKTMFGSRGRVIEELNSDLENLADALTRIIIRLHSRTKGKGLSYLVEGM